MFSQWFTDLFGFKEKTETAMDYAANKEQFELNGNLLKCKTSGQEFEAGVFATPALAELRAHTNIEEARAKLPGKLKVQQICSDVSVLHTDRDNQYAVFQAASQFNCLEFPSSRGVPENGIACYAGDKTQGPACAIACAPGTVVRNYFGLDGKGQQKDNQVNCLKECEELVENGSKRYFEVVNGYTLASGDEPLLQLSSVLEQSEEFKDEFRKRLRIGVQWDTEVTSSKFGLKRYEGPRQLVTQAYCSACSVSYSRGGTESWTSLASLVLEATYEATMYVALQNALNHEGKEGSTKVFLSAVGGGVFGNDIEWIAAAMERAFEPFRDVGLEVIIVSFKMPEKAFNRLLSADEDAAAAEGA